MTRKLLAAAIAVAFVGSMSAAEAANWHRHKRYYHRHYHAGWYAPAPRMSREPVYMHRRVGPPWAGPNQCFEDLGYGRYESCDAGK